jgi:MFS family permease
MSVAGRVLPDGAVASESEGLRRIAIATFVGTAMEWYDYYLFGLAASLVFNRLYFSGELSAFAASLAAFATFGVGFVARPFGAVLFGWVGDRIGRKPALIMTVTLIGVATGLIGLLPDFTAIGVAAPVLLVLLRLAQGVAVGGEWGGAVTMAVEQAPPVHRALYASMPQLGSPVAALLSSGAFALVLRLPSDQFDGWGWRLPFLVAFPLLGVAVYIRRAIRESPVFEAAVERAKDRGIPALDLLRLAPKPLALAIGGALLGVGGYYMLTTFAIGYGVRVLGISSAAMVNATLIAAAAEFFVIIAVGRIADRFQPWRVTCIGSLACAIIAVPVFMLMNSRDTMLVSCAITAGIATIAIVYAVSGALLTQLFPAQLRYSGVALAYNLAGVISGLLPLTATALLEASNDSYQAPAALLIAIALVTSASAYLSHRFGLLDEREAVDARQRLSESVVRRNLQS